MLSPKSPGSASLRHPDEFSDDSLNHSDDDAILTECIQSAMPKVALKLKKSVLASVYTEHSTYNN